MTAQGEPSEKSIKEQLKKHVTKVFGGVDFSGLFISLRAQHYDTLKVAKEAGEGNRAKKWRPR